MIYGMEQRFVIIIIIKVMRKMNHKKINLPSNLLNPPTHPDPSFLSHSPRPLLLPPPFEAAPLPSS